MNLKDKIKMEYAALISTARDMEELNKIHEAYRLGQESKDGSLWIISAKCDKIYKEIIDLTHGDNNE